ncbi:ComEC/Rec2 family competence protein [Sulfurimonas sp.]|uniref:ComEC/Rec2 family competence protein n=1 Tax=Sulfurimonas sp. TaxID=2022749 RepID=UPI0025F18CBF|nr:ComEC/Rec2 family competence protein [Sulfurimonas sp.]MDD5158019.1 ComEC/Rec2 family competence protein [Sulfurimonas sp.]
MLKRISLFSTKKEFFLFLLFCISILFTTVIFEYKNYKEFIRFDSQVVQATVIKQYTKEKNSKIFQVLKLHSDDGLTFYTTAKKSLKPLTDRKIEIEIFPNELSFYSYFTTFFAKSKIKQIYSETSLKQKVNERISNAHQNQDIANIYQALYTSAIVKQELQTAFSNLGVAHIISISGFHLGVLSAILYFFLSPIYRFFQSRFFPYRNSKVDLFAIVVVVLFFYMIFLDSPPALVRSFGMFVVGFVLYDRGIKILSMQTLLVTIFLLLAFFPRLGFTLGFWLSAGGVFYIFLFLIHFKNLSTLWQIAGISVLVYLFMLPASLFIFQNFTLYHPLSIILSVLFTPFYPLSIFLHFVGYGDFFDSFLAWLLTLSRDGTKIELSPYLFLLHIELSFLAIFDKFWMWALILLSSSIIIYAVYDVAKL